MGIGLQEEKLGPTIGKVFPCGLITSTRGVVFSVERLSETKSLWLGEMSFYN
jgi:hypothetical protein